MARQQQWWVRTRAGGGRLRRRAAEVWSCCGSHSDLCGRAQEVDCRRSVPMFGPSRWKDGSGDRSKHRHWKRDLQRPGRKRRMCWIRSPGARVVMACRDLARAERAAEEIRQSTGNGNVVIRHLDLASVYSVSQFAKDFLDSEDRLDILVNNAGVMMCPRWITEDGFETQIAVNHLGHFLLTNLLLPMLKSCAPSRVINVSSIAHRGGRMDFDDLFFSRRPYSALESYRQSKLANVLFTRELARRLKGSGVSAFCLHPGVIRTELGRHVEGWIPLLGAVLRLPALLLMKTPRQGSQTSVFCAVTPGLEDLSGRYFREGGGARGAGRRGGPQAVGGERPIGQTQRHALTSDRPVNIQTGSCRGAAAPPCGRSKEETTPSTSSGVPGPVQV
ncbi:retinol dehydrogenase 13 isoform X2 [Fundulus heteroclitus]|uniref:retinol dehydrogenase 13 isoform X2 n=1 Tax=Fundulus heteroclitus TaxID=8078 RepID=UPI00165A3E95|nr:retinol dehydrogenase 13 isoform X2 [Fundulus heteroclitus]